MIFPKDEGVGDWKSGEIQIGQSPTLGKMVFEFLGQETPKTTTFPSCGSVSPSLVIWFEQNVLKTQFRHSCRSQQGEMI